MPIIVEKEWNFFFFFHCKGVTSVIPQEADRQLIAGHEDPGTSQHRIEYGDPEVSIPQLAALVAASDSCSQTIKYECFGSVLFDPDEDHKPYAWWMNKYGQQRYTWTDHLDPTQSGCYCGVTKSEQELNYSPSFPQGIVQINSGMHEVPYLFDNFLSCMKLHHCAKWNKCTLWCT